MDWIGFFSRRSKGTIFNGIGFWIELNSEIGFLKDFLKVIGSGI